VRGKENSKPDKMSEFEEAVSRNELVAPLTWAQRLKRVFERAAIGSILLSALGAAELCEASDGAAFGSLIQT
jgi:hypothetical protein